MHFLFLARISPTLIYLCGIHWLLSSAYSDLFIIFKLILSRMCLIYLRKGLPSPKRYFVHETLLHNPSSHSSLSKLLQTLLVSITHLANKSYVTSLFVSWILSPQYDCKPFKGRTYGLCLSYRTPTRTQKGETTTVFRPQHLYQLLNGKY